MSKVSFWHCRLTLLLDVWQLKSLSFFATVRVIFQLTEEIPCIAAVVVALLADVSCVKELIFVILQ